MVPLTRRSTRCNPRKHSLEFLREIAHLRPRTNTFSAILRIRHALAFAVHKYYNDNGFFYLHTPIITASDAEGAGEMFRVTTLDAEKPPRDEAGKIDYKEDFFGQGNQPDRFGPTGRRTGCLGFVQNLHLRPHVPGRKLQHHPPPGGVLDDRAGNGVFRPERQHGSGRRFRENTSSATPWKTAPTIWIFWKNARPRRKKVSRKPSARCRWPKSCALWWTIPSSG